MRKLAAGPMALLLALAASPRAATAQCSGATCTITIQLPVNTVARMTLSSVATALGNPAAADFVTGYKDATGPTVTVKANRAWQVSLSSATATFSFASKPASDLLWGTNGSSYPNNGGAGATAFSGGAQASTLAGTVYFRTNWFFASNPPGTYNLTVNYTLSSP